MYAGRGAGLPNLYTVNPATAATTLVGNTGLGFSAVSAMAFLCLARREVVFPIRVLFENDSPDHANIELHDCLSLESGLLSSRGRVAARGRSRIRQRRHRGPGRHCKRCG